MKDKVNEAVSDIKPLLEIGREAYSAAYVCVQGEDDNHHDALDAAIMAVAAKSATHPARCVVDEEAALDAFDAACNRHSLANGTGPRVTWVGYTREDRLRVIRAAIQAAQPAVPKGMVLVPMPTFTCAECGSGPWAANLLQRTEQAESALAAATRRVAELEERWVQRIEASAVPEKSVAMQYLEEKQSDAMKQFHASYTEEKPDGTG